MRNIFVDRNTAETVARNVFQSACELDRNQATWLAAQLTDVEVAKLASPDSRQLPSVDEIRGIAADCAGRISTSLRPKSAA